jgi:hypothetical protein
MQSYWKPFVLIACFGILAACEESIVPTDSDTALELSAKPGATPVFYDYTFSGDIVGNLNDVPVSGSDPFKQLNSADFTFSFPTTSTEGDTGTCDLKNPELLPSVNAWDSYASGGWGGQVELSRRKRGAFHLQITGTQTDPDGGSINLALNDTPVEDTNAGGTAVIRFENARALVSAFSYAEVDGEGPMYDSQDRCVNFTITAERQ